MLGERGRKCRKRKWDIVRRLPAPIVREDVTSLEVEVLDARSECTHVEFERNKREGDRLVAGSVAKPVKGEDFVSSVKQTRNDLEISSLSILLLIHEICKARRQIESH